MHEFNNQDTIPAGKYQVIQSKINEEFHRRIKSTEEDHEKEKKEQKEILLRINKLETQYNMVSKILWALGGVFLTSFGSILVWFITGK